MTTIAINTVTGQRAAAVLPIVQVQYPAADLDYLCAGAVGVGLNRLFSPAFKFVAEDFGTPLEADDTVAVELDDADDARATSLAAELGVDVALVLSAALCTGLAKLVGDTSRLVGPFEVV